ncbi:hypothetical protein B0H16DRAFT_1750480 [Mycena metata]|uniref:Cation efflux protein transmembrane domain-containing protein n=1 Tax=Mycena metata TaxID=1033252 RepID=A0AAD7DP49_9AGAR|nr:hypothetical protein B0H16DRAFT_1750480 [Mycena metata]
MTGCPEPYEPDVFLRVLPLTVAALFLGIRMMVVFATVLQRGTTCGFGRCRVVVRVNCKRLDSYNWHGAGILAALINGAFLVALCFSISLEALEGFFAAPEISNSRLVIIVSFGLASNLVGLFLVHCHSHNHWHTAPDHSHVDAPKAKALPAASFPGTTSTSTNMQTTRRGEDSEEAYTGPVGLGLVTPRYNAGGGRARVVRLLVTRHGALADATRPAERDDAAALALPRRSPPAPAPALPLRWNPNEAHPWLLLQPTTPAHRQTAPPPSRAPVVSYEWSPLAVHLLRSAILFVMPTLSNTCARLRCVRQLHYTFCFAHLEHATHDVRVHYAGTSAGKRYWEERCVPPHLPPFIPALASLITYTALASSPLRTPVPHSPRPRFARRRTRALPSRAASS